MDDAFKFNNEFENLFLGNSVESDKLIIGLDFGTTFSGVAYAFTTNPDQVFCIETWPGADDKRVPKAPTIIMYDDESKTSLKWGYQVDPMTESKIERFKLLLDPDQDRPLYAPDNTKAEIENLGKDVMDIASDYIRTIYQHALQQIEQSFLEDWIKSYEKEYVLSVPAVWSDKAKDMTQQAASKAGIGPITLIKEPEAAALYTLHFNRNKGLQVGDAIVVCDAGGGTVDLISYEIMSLDSLEVKELVPCSGGLSGSIMLNERFEQWLQSTVGESAFSSLKTTSGFRSAMQSFDTTIKPGFRGKDDADKFVSFPMAELKDNPSKGIHRNSIVVKGTTLSKIFDPLIRDIVKLVTEQVNEVRIKRLRGSHPKGDSVKAIFLVGGFGSSMYLKQAIEASHPDIQVLQPPDAWSAVVKGAVMSKLPQEASVTSNVAEKHYGTTFMEIYDCVRDKGRPHSMDQWDEVERCEIMHWFIHKNDDLVRDKKMSLPLSHRIAGTTLDPQDLKLVVGLYESTASKAPVHPTDVKLNCILHADLTKVPAHHFVPMKRGSDGAPYMRLCYNLLVEIQSGPMKFSLEVDGQEHSAVQADY